MATAQVERNKQRLAEAEKDLGFIEQPARITSYDGTPAAELSRKREAENQRLLDEQYRKQVEAARAYAAQEKAKIDAVIDGNSLVAQLESETEEAQGALDVLYAKHRGVVSELATLEADAVTFEGVETDDLAAHAAAWQKKHAAGLAAARAAKAELERRIGVAEAGVTELRHSLHRAQRVSLHKHIDSLIADIEGPLMRAHDLLTEIRFYEEAVRNLGGGRQPLATFRFREALAHTVERWDRDVAEIVQFSEHYGDE